MVVFYHMNENEVKEYPNFHLSIELNHTNIVLLLVDKQNDKPVAMEEIPREKKGIQHCIENSTIYAKSSPETISCAIQNNFFSLVPTSVYQEKNKEIYLNFVSNTKDDLITLEDKLIKQEIINCFGINSQSKKELSSLFPNIKLKHIGSILIDSVEDGFYINFSTNNEFEVVVKENKKLIFFNRFSVENTEETLYYLSLVGEKTGLAIQEQKLFVSGFIKTKGEKISFWKQFIPEENITFNEIEESQLNAISRHKFFTLHKQYSCVL